MSEPHRTFTEAEAQKIARSIREAHARATTPRRSVWWVLATSPLFWISLAAVSTVFGLILGLAIQGI